MSNEAWTEINWSNRLSRENDKCKVSFECNLDEIPSTESIADRITLTKKVISLLNDSQFLQLIMVFPREHFDSRQIMEGSKDIRRIIW